MCGMCVCVCVCVCHLFKMTDNQVHIESVNILIFYIGKFCRINVNMEINGNQNKQYTFHNLLIKL